MEHRRIVRGRLVGPRRIELDEPVEDAFGEIDVTLTPVTRAAASPGSFVEWLRRLPPGTRTTDDIERQIAEERASWIDP